MIQVCIHIDMHRPIVIHIHKQILSCIYAYVHTFMHACTQTYTHTYVHTYVHTNALPAAAEWAKPTECAAAELGALTVSACQRVRGALFQSLDIKSQASSQKLLSTEPWLKPCRAPSKPTPHGSEPWKGWVDPPLLFPSLTPLEYTIFGPCGKTHYFSSLLETECGFTRAPEACSCRLPCFWGGGPHQKWHQKPASKLNTFL